MTGESDTKSAENLQIAFEAAHFLESQIPEHMTSEFDFDMTFDVGQNDEPLIIITVNTAESVRCLEKQFGSAVHFQQRGAAAVNVPILVRQFLPPHKMN